MRFRRVLISILLAQLVVAPVGAEPVLFTPEMGLSGPTHGDGSLKLLFGRPRAFHVRSLGTTGSDGSFVLEQTVAFEGKEPETRRWTVQTVAPLRYTGTLSNAPGAVSGYTSGQRLMLKYRVKGPLVMHQTLELLPEGNTIDNVGRVTLFGIPVGQLHETIRRGN